MIRFIVGFICLQISLSAFAQSSSVQVPSTTPATSAPAVEVKEDIVKDESNGGKPQKMERMEVTGSHIKRVDVEGPSPITTIDRKQLEKSGYNSVSDVLRNMTSATGGVGRESALSSGAATGAATMTLRGMGSDTVLILLDGRRMPTIGGSSSTDLNLIPMSAIERVEVLKDGASATYGSDALGGVINFITKKNFDGANTTIKYTHPEETGGTRTDVTGTYGKVGNDYTFLGVMSFRQNEALYLNNRAFGRIAPGDTGPLSPRGSPGTWQDVVTGANTPAADCPPEHIVNGVCKFDYTPYAMVTPQLKQYSAMLSATYNITPELKTFARLIGSRRETFAQLAPPPDIFSDATSTGGFNTQVPQATATGVLGLPATHDINIAYRLVDEGGSGPRKNTTGSNSYGVQTGISGFLTDTWEWEIGGTHMTQETKGKGIGGYANKTILYQMLQAGQFNPFKTSANKDNIAQALYQPESLTTSSLSGVDVKASGELFDMPAGAASLAIGATSFWQSYKEDGDDVTKSGAQWGGGTISTGSGSRNFQSLFAELGIPALTGLELQLAGRLDKYSDFGSTVNPKVGFKYKPADFIMLRGSWGTGFKAPTLVQLYQGKSAGYPFATDTVQCPVYNSADPLCEQKQIETIAGGNPNLKQENSNSFNVGTVIEPIKNLSFGVDYFEIRQTSVIASLGSNDGLQSIFSAEKAYGNAFLNSQYGINVVRDPSGAVTRIIAPNTNVSSNLVKGMDLSLSFKNAAFGNWDLMTSIDHSMIFTNASEPFPGLTVIEYNNLAGNPRWRNNISFVLANPSHSIGTVIRTIPGQKFNKERAAPGCCGTFRDHTELDLTYSYKGIWEKGTLSLGILNLFSTNRPYDKTNFGSTGYISTGLYDPFGRSFYMSYSQDF